MNLKYNLEFDICGIIIHIVLLVILNSLYSKSENNQLFKRFLFISLLSGIFDVISAITISYSTRLPVYVNLFTNTVYFVSAACTAYKMYLYIYTCVDFKPRFDIFASRLVLFGYFILLAANCFTGIIFNFAGGTYNAGPLYLLNYLVPFFYFLHFTYLLVFKSELFSEKQKILHSFIIILPVAAIIIQIIYPKNLLTFFAYAIFSVIMLFSLETPDFEELEYLRKNLENEVERQTATANERREKIQTMSMEIVEALADAIDAKDSYTNGHSLRVAKYSVLLAESLGWHGEQLDILKRCALLHDVGKIGIPDSILQKPMKLSDEEFAVIKNHTITGSKILKNISSLPEASLAAKYHHECYDGTGYPEGLQGKNIPDYARIISIADAFDAMNTKRIYRDKLCREEIRRRLTEGSGTQFDPDLMEKFLMIMDMNLI